jgi:hypothetical protein
VNKGSINVHAGSKVVSFFVKVSEFAIIPDELSSLAYQVMETKKCIIVISGFIFFLEENKRGMYLRH